jgi:hypothetical protein
VARKRFDTRADTEASLVPYGEDCPYCVRNNETHTPDGGRRRQRHYLMLASTEGMDGLKAHLTLYLHRWHAKDPDKADETLHSTLAWVAGIIEIFSEMPDEVTGEPLPWWEARRRMIAATPGNPLTAHFYSTAAD